MTLSLQLDSVVTAISNIASRESNNSLAKRWID